MNRYGEMEAPLDDQALEEISTILKSLTGNGSVSNPQRLNNDGGPSKTEMEQFKKDLMDQRTQMTTFLEKIGEMEKEVAILQSKSEKNDSEIENLQSLLASEREGKTEMEDKINCLDATIKNLLNYVKTLANITTATVESVKVINKEKRQETSKVDEAIKVLTKEIEYRFTNGMENHERLINNIQRVQESVEELIKAVEEKHIKSDTHLIVSETDNGPSGQIQQLSELRNPEVSLGDDGNNKEVLVIAYDDEMEDEAAPQVQKIMLSGAVGREIGSKNKESLYCASSATVQTQKVTHAVDNTKRGGIFCVCGRKFNSKQNLHNHVLYLTATDADKKFHCSSCPKRFLRLSYLNLHLRRTHKINTSCRGRGCRKCGKVCKTHKELATHSKSCKGGKVEKKQQITRSRPKPGSGKTPHHGRDLTRANRCLCGMTFRDKCGRNKHVKYHTERKHRCKYCDKRFEFPGRLYRHVQKSHGDELSEGAAEVVDAGRHENTWAPPPPQLSCVPKVSDGGEGYSAMPHLCLESNVPNNTNLFLKSSYN